MVNAPPTTPTTPELPVLCVSCGYALAGLADDGVCPECATSVAQSVAARRGWFPSPRHLAVANRCLGAMFWCAALYLVAHISRYFWILLPLPSIILFIYTAQHVAALIWHIAFYVLAVRDPTSEAAAPAPLRNRLVRACAVLSAPIILYNLAMLWGWRWAGGPGVGGAAFWGVTYFVTGALPAALACVQVAAGARLLARCRRIRRRSSLRTRGPDLPFLRWTALAALGAIVANWAVGAWIAWIVMPARAQGAAGMGIASLVYGALMLGLLAALAALFVQALLALIAARSGVRRAMEDAQLQAVIEAELATVRTP